MKPVAKSFGSLLAIAWLCLIALNEDGACLAATVEGKLAIQGNGVTAERRHFSLKLITFFNGHAVETDEPGPSQETSKTTFRFTNLKSDPQVAYLVRAEFEGATFVSPIIRFQNARQTVHTAIAIYPPVTDRSHLALKRLHLRLTPNPSVRGILHVVETVTVENASLFTVMPPTKDRGNVATVRIPLPKVHDNIQPEFQFDENEIDLAPNTLSLYLPIAPGESRFVVSYQIPYLGKTTSLALPLPDSVSEIVTMVPDDIALVSRPPLTETNRKYYEAHRYRVLKSKAAPSGRSLDLTLSRLPLNLAAEKTALPVGSLVIAIVALAWTLRQRRTRQRRSSALHHPTLTNLRTNLLWRLARLELADKKGHQDPTRYRSEKNALLRQLISIYDYLVAVGPWPDSNYPER